MEIPHADDLRKEFEEKSAYKNEAAIKIQVKHVVERIKKGRKTTFQALMPEVVKMLEEKGFKVKFNRACGMGDVDSHTISW